MEYELVIGLETHVELSTATKMFCGCEVTFAAAPNTRCCPVCLGLPGALPTLNQQAVASAVTAGLALHCQINPVSVMERKNYIYPDLAKAYQISQHRHPLCRGGYVTLRSGKRIHLQQLHMEEDAGKLVYEPGRVYIDYNRGGIPLIEIVSLPELSSAEEACEYLETLQRLMRYLGISDCKMQEGSLRCDVNLSVRPVGCAQLGMRTEIKNMNSFSYMRKAIAYEAQRQIALLRSGFAVEQETRRYDVPSGTTRVMRSKENAQDYRYFPEPDLLPVSLPGQWVNALRADLPELPDARAARYEALGVSPAIAQELVRFRAVADYFDAAIRCGASPVFAAKMLIGPYFEAKTGEQEREAFSPCVYPEQLAQVCKKLDTHALSPAQAKAMLGQALRGECTLSQALAGLPEHPPEQGVLEELCRKALRDHGDAVQSYLSGKEKAFQVLVGAVLRAAQGKADPQAVRTLLKQMVDERSFDKNKP
ncbi:MAG: Asp-tRNA(Asn)/Glu-tRNA(Gln) amidotransferase subunit GatB [Eubacteriales bacterium]|nr:Asp-tRNA(Asn)/Glu-tRNA(Gln) amidotransferase subunit GatB [Eubacteriales bacterium]